MPVKRITVPGICAHCGRNFRPRLEAVMAGRGRYCSVGCRSEGIRIAGLPVVSISGDGLTASIPLCGKDGSVRACAIIDTADAVTVSQWRWSLLSNGYATRTADGKAILLHRFLLGLSPGDRQDIDHIDRDRLNNRRANLRIVTHAGNTQNHPGFPNASSSHRGVSWYKRRQQWSAYVCPDRKKIHLGYFDSEIEAAAVAKAARARLMPYATD